LRVAATYTMSTFSTELLSFLSGNKETFGYYIFTLDVEVCSNEDELKRLTRDEEEFEWCPDTRELNKVEHEIDYDECATILIWERQPNCPTLEEIYNRALSDEGLLYTVAREHEKLGLRFIELAFVSTCPTGKYIQDNMYNI